MDLETKVERLKQEATDRWGERWTVEIRQYADGDYQALAFSSRGQDEDGYLVRDRLFMDKSGDTAVERATVGHREIKSEPIEEPEHPQQWRS
jgi:predicted phage gp36 major capsid-like protein